MAWSYLGALCVVCLYLRGFVVTGTIALLHATRNTSKHCISMFLTVASTVAQFMLTYTRDARYRYQSRLTYLLYLFSFLLSYCKQRESITCKNAKQSERRKVCKQPLNEPNTTLETFTARYNSQLLDTFNCSQPHRLNYPYALPRTMTGVTPYSLLTQSFLIPTF